MPSRRNLFLSMNARTAQAPTAQVITPILRKSVIIGEPQRKSNNSNMAKANGGKG